MTKGLTPIQRENKESFIEMPKLFRNAKFTENEIFMYAIIEGLSRNPLKVAHTGVNQIITFMGMFVNSKTKGKVKESLECLRKLGLIEVYDDNILTTIVEEIKPANYYFIQTIEREKELGFTKVFYTDFYKIITLDDKYRMKILRVYFEIMSHIFYTNTNPRVAFPNIDTIADATSIDRKSVMRYVEVLMENQIIYCLTIKISEKKNKNYYGRWIHKEEVMGYAIQNEEGEIEELSETA
ncbi:hypothetical protein [Peribacillus simplex]|uniref:hypothetical protein n=1 Tax=Peribacillus simplex TaxID=1478 RepID=UPI003D26BFA6